MFDLKAGDAIVLVWMVVVTIGYIVAMIRARRPGMSVGAFLLGGPLVYLRPKLYFAVGRKWMAWKGMMWWFLSLSLVNGFARVVPRLLSE